MESWQRISKWMKGAHPDDLYGKSGELSGESLRRAEHAWRLFNTIPLDLLQGASGKVDYAVFHSLTAFLMYQWDSSNSAGLSLSNALTASYSEAYVLLRSSLELLLDGMLFQCLAQERFMEQGTSSLKPTDSLAIQCQRLPERIKDGELDASELEANSAAIFDLLREDWLSSAFTVQIGSTVRLLADWGMFAGMDHDPVKTVSDLFGNLSAGAHTRITHTNAGRAVEEGAEIFEWPAPLLAESLSEFLGDFHLTMETMVIAELTLLSHFVEDSSLRTKCQRLLENEVLAAANLAQVTRLLQRWAA